MSIYSSKDCRTAYTTGFENMEAGFWFCLDPEATAGWSAGAKAVDGGFRHGIVRGEIVLTTGWRAEAKAVDGGSRHGIGRHEIVLTAGGAKAVDGGFRGGTVKPSPGGGCNCDCDGEVFSYGLVIMDCGGDFSYGLVMMDSGEGGAACLSACKFGKSVVFESIDTEIEKKEFQKCQNFSDSQVRKRNVFRSCLLMHLSQAQALVTLIVTVKYLQTSWSLTPLAGCSY